MAFALTYVLGYERELRGSPAGDRTFSLIGTASAVLGNLAGVGSPNAIAGAVTGIGFIGGGIVVRRAVRTGEIISGITTAASIFATAAIGAAAGAGLLAVAALATGLVLVALEGPTFRCSGWWTPAAGRRASITTRNCIATTTPPCFPTPRRQLTAINGRHLRQMT